VLTVTNRRGPPGTALIISAVVFAYAGFLTHNLADLPGQTPLSPESLIPTLITLALLGLWLMPATRRAGAWGLLVWATLHLVGGGILSVLPIGVFPFTPDQSWSHYAFHLVYTVTQVPLVWICIVWLRRSSPR
jgi:Na+/melibiose symporter-like transporter